jgi:hypothetical protein
LLPRRRAKQAQIFREWFIVHDSWFVALRDGR